MTYGRERTAQGRRLWPRVLFLLAGFLPVLALRPVLARPAPASEQTVTLLSVGPNVLQVQGVDGRAFAVRIGPTTWILQRGEVAAPGALLPGATLRVRLGRGRAGARAGRRGPAGL